MDVQSFFQQQLKEYQRSLADTKDDEFEFKSGETKGPYVAIRKCRIGKIKNGSVGLTMTDYTGEKYILELSGQDPIRRIIPCSSPLLANCVLLLTGSENYLQILITRNIRKGELLNAILVPEKRIPDYFQQQQLQQTVEAQVDRKFECDRCNLAKFSSAGNLKIHQEHYCSKRDEHEEKTKKEERLKRLKEEEKKIMSLQMALKQIQEKQAAFQLLNLTPGGLHPILREHMVSSFAHDAAIISAATAAVNTPIPFSDEKSPVLPASTNLSISPQMNISIPVINLDETEGQSSSTPVGMMTPKLSDIPSTSSSSLTSSPGSSKIIGDPEKPFNCSCGVSFCNEQTFHAHQYYYCKNAISAMNQQNDISRKIPDKCVHCDFQPDSSSHLQLHMRNAHQSANTFICSVCGYRAFSMRGIRTHMRCHPAEDANKFEACPSTEKLRKTSSP